jgi:hypothetical protein
LTTKPALTSLESIKLEGKDSIATIWFATCYYFMNLTLIIRSLRINWSKNYLKNSMKFLKLFKNW